MDLIFFSKYDFNSACSDWSLLASAELGFGREEVVVVVPAMVEALPAGRVA
jgi:hypothetical protein